ncbi:MAG: EAL domain-containing protein [Betaproteobacteria bacterium]|nr:EAL domain-containing protein [Betaproteobacteria bacterium]
MSGVLLMLPPLLGLLWAVQAERRDYQDAARAVAYRATLAGRAESELITLRLMRQFQQLSFVANGLIGSRFPQDFTFSRQKMVRRFVALEPNLFAFNIQSPDGKRIVWSTFRQSRHPIFGSIEFTPLPNHPDFFLGQDVYARRFRHRILSMRYRMHSAAGGTAYFIGSPYRIKDLLANPDPAAFAMAVRDLRDGGVVGTVAARRPAPAPDPSSGGMVVVPVPDMPLSVEVRWPNTLVWQDYRQGLSKRLAWRLSIVLLLLLSAAAVETLLRRVRRLAQRNAQAAAQEAAARTFSDALFDALGTVVLVIDGQGSIERMNDAAQQLMGPVKAEVIGVPYQWERFVPEHERARVRNAFQALREPSALPDLESHWISHTGEERLFRWVNSRLEGPDGRPSRLITVGMDITDQRKLEQELKTSSHRLQRLSDFNALAGQVNQAIAAASDEATLLATICELAVRYARLELAAIFRPGAQGRFEALAAAGEVAYLAGLALSTDPATAEGRGPTGNAWAGKKAVFVDDFEQCQALSPWRERYRRFGFSATASLPIVREGKPWGVFSIYHSERNVFDDDLRASLEELAFDISRGLEQIESRSLQDALLNNSVAGIFLVRERIIRQANVRGARMLGYEPADLVGRPARMMFVSDGEWARFQDEFAGLEAADECQVSSVRMKHKDGSVLIGDFSAVRLKGREAWSVWTIEDVTERERLGEELARQALFDQLTDLPNRRALEREFHKAMARVRRSGKMLAVVMMDLDGFKEINDTHGHDVGDAVLQTVGRRLQGALRRTDFIARLGGDEFVLLVEDCGAVGDLAEVLNKVEAAINAPIPLVHDLAVDLTVSAGICFYPEIETDNPETLLRYADQALYASKAAKADRLHFWTRYGIEGPRRETSAQALLRGGALRVFYQPVLDTDRAKIVGMEALARLQGVDGRIVSPGEFLPGLTPADLFDLSSQVLHQALSDLAQLDAVDASLWVSVNVDPRNITESCIVCLRDQIRSSRIAPSRIYLEILEGSPLEQRHLVLEHLRALKAEGVRLALDDVGSAYSSLLRLKDLPIDKIKLDQGFIRTLEDHARDLHFVASILDLANGLGVDMVVEGVETEDIFDAMCMMRVPNLQGYNIGRPMPFGELKAYLRRPPPAVHRQPTTFLGVCARQLSNHNALKRVLLNNPGLFSEALAQANHCPIHEDLHRFGVPDDHEISRLHRDYHRLMARWQNQALADPSAIALDALISVENALQGALMAEYHARKCDALGVCAAPPDVPSDQPLGEGAARA